MISEYANIKKGGFYRLRGQETLDK